MPPFSTTLAGLIALQGCCLGIASSAIPPVISSSRLLGLPIQNYDQQPLGVLRELLLDSTSGRPTFAVVVMNEPHRSVLVPWRAFRIQPDADGRIAALLLDATPDKLRNSTESTGALLTDRQRRSIYRYWGVAGAGS